MDDDMKNRRYREYVLMVNREPPEDGEYGRIAARGALTAAYGLDRYPKPNQRKIASTP